MCRGQMLQLLGLFRMGILNKNQKIAGDGTTKTPVVTGSSPSGIGNLSGVQSGDTNFANISITATEIINVGYAQAYIGVVYNSPPSPGLFLEVLEGATQLKSQGFGSTGFSSGTIFVNLENISIGLHTYNFWLRNPGGESYQRSNQDGFASNPALGTRSFFADIDPNIIVDVAKTNKIIK